MPRGVAIPEIRQQLFGAAERVVVRDGPGRLSGRAVTSEAGVATGVLYAHFADLDDFLAAYAIDRSFQVSAEAATLTGRAGGGSIADNLCEALLATPLSVLPAMTRLLVARPDLHGRIRAVLGERTAGLEAVEASIASYLAEERRRGRLSAAADPAAVALTLVGALHHLVLTASEPEIRRGIQQAVTALVDQRTAVPGQPVIENRGRG